MIHRVETRIGANDLIIETGKLAKQAAGAVTVRLGDTVVLATVSASRHDRPDADFLPLAVDYRESFYAAGSRAASSSAKGARTSARSSPAGSSTGRSGRCSPPVGAGRRR